MQFKVPQFIDVEDKVVGPLTFKQFAYLAGGAGLVYLSLRLPSFIGLPLAGVFAALALALAFYKYNDKPFIHVLEAVIRFYAKSRLYLWHKTLQKQTSDTTPAQTPITNRSTLTESKLKTLSWSLDVINPTDEINNK
jgi:hypothetical protein